MLATSKYTHFQRSIISGDSQPIMTLLFLDLRAGLPEAIRERAGLPPLCYGDPVLGGVR
jgi:hypothetical protein